MLSGTVNFELDRLQGLLAAKGENTFDFSIVRQVERVRPAHVSTL
jgi:hypothetical protein